MKHVYYPAFLNIRGTPSLTFPPRGGRKGGGETHAYYPAFLNLKGKKVVVIGGGNVAERKVLSLLETGSYIKVISPCLTKRLEKEKIKSRIEHIRRQYRKGDLKNAFLVFATTDSLVINEQVSKDSPYLVNVVDTPSLCNFIVPSILKRGPLRIVISTSGISPALSRAIRKELEKLYGLEFNVYLRFLKGIRTKAVKIIQDKKKRREFLKTVASEKMIKMLRRKGLRETKKVVDDLLKRQRVT